jgi:Domain of unknown function (DUF305)
VTFNDSIRATLAAGAIAVAIGLASLGSGHAQEAPPQALAAEAPFLAENDAAMDRMMAGMAIRPTGDVDRDFAAMMEPHHLAAIDMAQSLLRHGHNEQLKRIAQEIIVTQQQEIAAMRLALGQALPSSVPAPDQVSKSPSADTPPAPHHTMHMHQEP